MRELADCIICISYSLCSFFASDTDTNMSLDNHGHIVGTITN